jgi:fumarate hydratase subunit beta
MPKQSSDDKYMMHLIKTPLTREKARELRAGDHVGISGILYTARDAAHKRMSDLIKEFLPLPFDIVNQIIYYTGPCPPQPGRIIGSAGPTTGGRMDSYTSALIELGLTGMIGKGKRSMQVIDSMITYGAVYFGAAGGAGALLAQHVESVETIAFPELGTESLKRLTVKDFPALVVIDSFGNDLYKEGRAAFFV